MKTITMLVATAALITGIAAANAQGTTKQMDEQAGGNSGAVERNPNGTTGGTKANPSPSTTVQRVHRGCQRRKIAPGRQSRLRLPAM